jgi:hypothetical protein
MVFRQKLLDILALFLEFLLCDLIKLAIEV